MGLCLFRIRIFVFQHFNEYSSSFLLVRDSDKFRAHHCHKFSFNCRVCTFFDTKMAVFFGLIVFIYSIVWETTGKIGIH